MNIKEILEELNKSPKWKKLSFSDKIRAINKVTKIVDFYKKHELDEKIESIDSSWILARINKSGYNRLNKLDQALALAIKEAENNKLIDFEAEKAKMHRIFDGRGGQI